VSLLNDLYNKFSNLSGFHTARKIILFLSDDWGSSRVRSLGARDVLMSEGLNLNENRFDRYDTLESNQDIEYLFDILMKHKDQNGNSFVITVVCNVANPDFKKIKNTDFREYFYEPFTETLIRYPGHDRVYDLYKEGIHLNIFKPEFHGREHLQVKWWISALQSGGGILRKAFEEEFWFVAAKSQANPLHRGFGSAFDIAKLDEVNAQKEIIADGVQLFIKLFGYQPVLFVPPAQHYHQRLEPIIAETGIKMIDVPRLRKMPLGKATRRLKLHYLGQKSRFGLRYLTRNAVFEPNLNEQSDGVNECMAAIENAFKHNKPAIISNHRAAFSGGLDLKNRDKGLKALDRLLSGILKKWPEVEFMSASAFYDILIGK